MPLAGGLVAGVIAFVLGFLLAAYRGIFFAMLSLAFSMILYGLLIKIVAARQQRRLQHRVHQRWPASRCRRARTCTRSSRWRSSLVALALYGTHRFLRSHTGRLGPAIRDNELRVEYMGASVRRLVHLNYVIAAVLSGIGGGLVALSIGHIDPDLAYWTTSGEFVFVAILSGTGNVVAPFLGSLVFEWIKSVAYQYTPNTWQMVLGIAMLLVIMFLPDGPVVAVHAATQGRVMADHRSQRRGQELRRGDRRRRHRRCASSTTRWSASSAATAPARPRSSTW